MSSHTRVRAFALTHCYRKENGFDYESSIVVAKSASAAVAAIEPSPTRQLESIKVEPLDKAVYAPLTESEMDECVE